MVNCAISYMYNDHPGNPLDVADLYMLPPGYQSVTRLQVGVLSISETSIIRKKSLSSLNYDKRAMLQACLGDVIR